MLVKRYRVVSSLMMIDTLRQLMLTSGKNVEIRNKAQYDAKEPDRQKFEEEEEEEENENDRAAVSHYNW